MRNHGATSGQAVAAATDRDGTDQDVIPLLAIARIEIAQSEPNEPNER
jgi:hypothetical protein